MGELYAGKQSGEDAAVQGAPMRTSDWPSGASDSGKEYNGLVIMVNIWIIVHIGIIGTVCLVRAFTLIFESLFFVFGASLRLKSRQMWLFDSECFRIDAPLDIFSGLSLLSHDSKL